MPLHSQQTVLPFESMDFISFRVETCICRLTNLFIIIHVPLEGEKMSYMTVAGYSDIAEMWLRYSN